MVADDHDRNADETRDDANNMEAEVEQVLDTLQNEVDKMMRGGINRDLDIRTPWAVFPAPDMYDDEQDGEADMMLGEGPWFDRRALKEGGIVHKYCSITAGSGSDTQEGGRRGRR